MKTSFLLDYIIKQANGLNVFFGKSKTSTDMMTVVLFRIFNSKANGTVPAAISAEASVAELNKTEQLFSVYGLVYSEAVKKLSDALKPNGSGADGESLFEKISSVADKKAAADGKSEVDMVLFAQYMLANPTENLKMLGITSRTETSEEDKAPASSDTDEAKAAQNALFDRIRAEFGGAKPKPPKEEAAAEAAEPELSGMEKLSKTVYDSRNIRRTLLEHVFGQDRAVNTFVSGYFQAELMKEIRKGTKKPQATFLFAGPPGVGKTYLAEKAAEALARPYKRFDMSEYADNEAIVEFAGSDQVYKNGKAGNVTSFVAENPHCVLLFDEIEKAHLNVIYLFLQILDAGRIRDNFTDEEVSFTDAVIIFTTNVGKNLYDDPTVVNLSDLPRKKILKALSEDKNPANNAPLFPAAICSRFASGNVVMFNHLGANNLVTIVEKELKGNISGFEKSTGIEISADPRISSAIMFSEGGKADARTVKGRANAFFHEELYELFRLLSSGKVSTKVEDLKNIDINISLPENNEQIASLFVNPSSPELLLFASEEMINMCAPKLQGVRYHATDDIDEAKNILFNNDISVILCDVNCKVKNSGAQLLNAEDTDSVGADFLSYALSRYDIPLYLVENNEDDITQEEFLSFAKVGVRGVLSLNPDEKANFTTEVIDKCNIAYLQSNMLALAKANKILSYKTSQTVSEDGTRAVINLFGFALDIATDTEDSKNILTSVSKPDIKFTDVIGAEDAKSELKYFVEYLKNPIKFMRRGVRAPKGILLYGPPGTGKTLLAKAMAGESDVTFIRAEGNQFLKKFVGEGAEALHKLFISARKYAPSIIFIDEIDAIGKDRMSGSLNSETSADVLTALLTEMDGFNVDTSKPVFVLAATNYGVESNQEKRLDAALLRRFDRRIYVDLPNKDERARYIKMKMKKNSAVSLSDEQVDNIAVRSTGMSLAELESIFEMALRGAIKNESGTVGDREFEEAFETFSSGEEKKWNPDTLLRTARHEAGHALVCWHSGEKPTYLTIVARGDHGGYMQHGDSEGKGVYTRAELLSKIRTSLGGRAAELVYYGEEDGVSTGASGDLHTATRIAEQMICSYGMDDTIGLSAVDPSRVSDSYASVIRGRVNEILTDEMDKAKALISGNRESFDELVDALMKNNHLKENEIDEILKKQNVK